MPKQHIIPLNSLIPTLRYGIHVWEEIKDLGSLLYKMEDDTLTISQKGIAECMQTPDTYALPLRIDLTAATDGEDLCLYYNAGAAIFNRKARERLVFNDGDIITGRGYEYHYPPQPANQLLDISWVIEKAYMSVHVNGEELYRRTDLPYHKEIAHDESKSAITNHVCITAANNSIINVKSLAITEL